VPHVFHDAPDALHKKEKRAPALRYFEKIHPNNKLALTNHVEMLHLLKSLSLVALCARFVSDMNSEYKIRKADEY
jgi:hypothetical protein